MSRVGLVALDTGRRCVLELERPLEEFAGSFAGPDASGRYAYFERNGALLRMRPTTTQSLLFGSRLEREYEESWRTKRDAHDDPFERAMLDPTSRRLVVGDLRRPGERVLDERHPADVLEKALALAPTTGELAFFAFDFDAERCPRSLHLEVWDLDGGAPRSFPLGRPCIDAFGGPQGPALAWLGDERHLVFRRASASVDRGGIYSIPGDWNGGFAPIDDPSEAPAARRERPASAHTLCALDTTTGSVRDVCDALFAWPTGTGDEVLVSDAHELWIVHVSTGATEARRAIGADSRLRPAWKDRGAARLAVVGLASSDRLLVERRVEPSSVAPRDWVDALHTDTTHFGIALATADGELVQDVLPLATVGPTTFVRANLPPDLPAFRRSPRRDGE